MAATDPAQSTTMMSAAVMPAAETTEAAAVVSAAESAKASTMMAPAAEATAMMSTAAVATTVPSAAMTMREHQQRRRQRNTNDKQQSKSLRAKHGRSPLNGIRDRIFHSRKQASKRARSLRTCHSSPNLPLSWRGKRTIHSAQQKRDSTRATCALRCRRVGPALVMATIWPLAPYGAAPVGTGSAGAGIDSAAGGASPRSTPRSRLDNSSSGAALMSWSSFFTAASL